VTTIRLELVTPEIGRLFYQALTSLDALALIETPSEGAEGGSNSLEVETPGIEPGSAVVWMWRLRA